MGYYCNSTIVIVITIAILCRGGTRALTEARGSYSCRGKGAIFKINRGAVRYVRYMGCVGTSGEPQRACKAPRSLKIPKIVMVMTPKSDFQFHHNHYYFHDFQATGNPTSAPRGSGELPTSPDPGSTSVKFKNRIPSLTCNRNRGASHELGNYNSQFEYQY